MYENGTVICFLFVGVTRDVNMVVVDKGNFGDGNIVHKGNVSDTNLVDRALVDNVGETRDVDMLVVDNVVNSDQVDNGKGVSIDDEILAKRMKLDTRKSAMTQKDHVISKKRKSVSKCNDIVIRENDNPSFDSDSDCENKNDQENQVNSFGNETDMGSETESDEYKRSFDYLSDCDYEVVKLRKRKSASKINIDEGDENASSEHEDFRPPTKNYDIGANTFQDHYGLLSYGKAFHDSNEGSTVKIGVTVNPDEKTYFDRCGNNHIFHVAWAVVTMENKENWIWFLELLADDLEISNGFGLTLISDQNKINTSFISVKEVMHSPEHRQCARHIYEGFRKQFSEVEFRSLFWPTSKASYPQLFMKIMQKIKLAHPRAHEYLIKKDPKSWLRAFFQEGINYEAVENEFSECLNFVLVSVGNKPIITMLESIRVIFIESNEAFNREMD
ncbi:hypothetical protein Tco_0286126 [Tanacetum coccineum]